EIERSAYRRRPAPSTSRLTHPPFQRVPRAGAPRLIFSIRTFPDISGHFGAPSRVGAGAGSKRPLHPTIPFARVPPTAEKPRMTRAGWSCPPAPTPNPPAVMPESTRLLDAAAAGDSAAAEQLLPLVYDELRKLAAQRLAQEKPGQTLQATA